MANQFDLLETVKSVDDGLEQRENGKKKQRGKEN